MSLKQCVVGFMFCKPQVHCDAHVVMIKKYNPEWQRGRLNGVGGKLEENESPKLGMVREFKEETGLDTQQSDWKPVCVYDCFPHNTKLFFFKTFTDKMWKVEPYLNPPEEVSWHNAERVMNLRDGLIIPNLRWLLPFALYCDYLVTPHFEERIT